MSDIINPTDEVAVVQDTQTGMFIVSFPYDVQLTKMIRDVPGAEYQTDSKVYFVPQSAEEMLGKTANAMRYERNQIAGDFENIKELATASALKAQRENGAQDSAAPQVSDYKDTSKFYSGPIINLNTRFAAQLNGFGKNDGVGKHDGAAFVSIHRLADLDNAKFLKGDAIGIKYDAAKFTGKVTELSKVKSAEMLEAEFSKQDGELIDGVAASQNATHVTVKFDLNAAMLARIKRIDGAAFNKEAGSWEVPIGAKSFALKAVNDMRVGFVQDQKEIEAMTEFAGTKMDNAKVTLAWNAEGQEHFGPIVAVGDRFALQKSGPKFNLHSLAALDKVPAVGTNLAVKYTKGVGITTDQDKKKVNDKELGR